ncbi:hypothetical protein TRV_00369 [Trichophyton verrucosum HKI 0517]|uniref:Peptidase family T4 protein n=1 Tax=Trichophyton verrucosum (strain HKI 0517) TaxID=663202 RepID=D4CZX5_TRIVH|nr:uncharacterized protein TRV_00369 [Trichophyton verrucosum HKI 0517]EFE44818.1 hypothetical protein TRV_00369 [Trichophyton verrucosum HKI 0517]
MPILSAGFSLKATILIIPRYLRAHNVSPVFYNICTTQVRCSRILSQWPNNHPRHRGCVSENFYQLFISVTSLPARSTLTDVPGVKVNTQEVHGDDGAINTGVTCILPRDNWSEEFCYAGPFSFNSAGELTGANVVNETGLLISPIVLTGTLEIVKPEHVVAGLENASAERVKEGNTGGGTGMICHRFKAGTGSSSRVVPRGDGKPGVKGYTIGALVQTNYGKMKDLRIGGVPIGRILAADAAKDEARKAALEDLAREKDRKDGSIIVVLATDAPLHPLQLQRIAKRATVGLARVGGNGHNTSGDIFLAFSTGNSIPNMDVLGPRKGPTPLAIEVIDDKTIDNLFDATADVTEEAIYNALCMAETMTGYLGRKVEALPLDRVKEIVTKSDVSSEYLG